MQRLRWLVLVAFPAALPAVNLPAAALPDSALNLKLSAPINSWDEAVPLGNGTMGVLLWGKDNTLRLSLDGGERDRQIIAASLKDWDSKGTGAWCGHSFSWMSCLRARVGGAEAALRNLDIYVHAFILRNGFHANGDQTKSGFSGFTYRPFTLEGNFLAMQAVHEMLLQSWSPTPGKRDSEIIRIFPATPWRWHEAAFDDLRAEGGWRVSARRENNATTWFKISAMRTGRLRLRDNFGGRTPKWNHAGVKKTGDNFEVARKPARAWKRSWKNPNPFRPAPENLAAPVKIKKLSP